MRRQARPWRLARSSTRFGRTWSSPLRKPAALSPKHTRCFSPLRCHISSTGRPQSRPSVSSSGEHRQREAPSISDSSMPGSRSAPRSTRNDPMRAHRRPLCPSAYHGKKGISAAWSLSPSRRAPQFHEILPQRALCRKIPRRVPALAKSATQTGRNPIVSCPEDAIAGLEKRRTFTRNNERSASTNQSIVPKRLRGCERTQVVSVPSPAPDKTSAVLSYVQADK